MSDQGEPDGTGMDPQRLRTLFSQLQVWKQGGIRAPHKCLLALWAIGRCRSGERRMASYRTVGTKLGELLREFGPPRKAIHTEVPFWRLQNDNVWEIENGARVRLTTSGDPHKRDLLRHDVRGGLPEDVYSTLRADHRLAAEVAHDLLAAHFPETRHDDILQAVGLDPDFLSVSRQKMRDPGFRRAVLRAYEQRCAVCAFDVRLGNRTIALDAAHIKWHQAGGPDDVRNGIALCVLHHKLFDEGAFTLSPPENGSVVLVSESAHGTTGFDEWLGRFHRRAVRSPIRNSYRPGSRFVAWSFREVFQPPARS